VNEDEKYELTEEEIQAIRRAVYAQCLVDCRNQVDWSSDAFEQIASMGNPYDFPV